MSGKIWLHRLMNPNIRTLALLRCFSVAAFCVVGCQQTSVLDNVKEELEKAACASQAFLRSNGYLDQVSTMDKREIQLEMFDMMSYGNNGTMDWDALLASRHGRYSNKLKAVKKNGDGYVAVYRSERDSKCVRVSADLNEVYISESQCKPSEKSLLYLVESELACR